MSSNHIHELQKMLYDIHSIGCFLDFDKIRGDDDSDMDIIERLSADNPISFPISDMAHLLKEKAIMALGVIDKLERDRESLSEQKIIAA